MTDARAKAEQALRAAGCDPKRRGGSRQWVDWMKGEEFKDSLSVMVPGDDGPAVLSWEVPLSVIPALLTAPALATDAANLRARVAQLEGAIDGLLDQVGEYPADSFPPPTHEGPCHPDAGCDGICADRYNMMMHNAAMRYAQRCREGTNPAPPVWTELQVLQAADTLPDRAMARMVAQGIIASLHKGRKEAKGHG